MSTTTRSLPIWRRVHKNVNHNKLTYRVRKEKATRKMVHFHQSVTNLIERPVLQRTLTPGHSLSSMYQSFEDSLSHSSSVNNTTNDGSTQQNANASSSDNTTSVENNINNNQNTLNRNHVQFIGMNDQDIQKYTLFQRQLTPRPDSFFYSTENWKIDEENENEHEHEHEYEHEHDNNDNLYHEDDHHDGQKSHVNIMNNKNVTNHHVHFNSIASFNIACLPKPPMHTGANVRYFSSTPTPRPCNTMDNRVKLPLLNIASSMMNMNENENENNMNRSNNSNSNNSSSNNNNNNKINRQLTPRVQIVDIFGNNSNSHFSTTANNNESNDTTENNNDADTDSNNGAMMKKVTLAIPINYAYKGPLKRTLTPMFPSV